MRRCALFLGCVHSWSTKNRKINRAEFNDFDEVDSTKSEQYPTALLKKILQNKQCVSQIGWHINICLQIVRKIKDTSGQFVTLFQAIYVDPGIRCPILLRSQFAIVMFLCRTQTRTCYANKTLATNKIIFFASHVAVNLPKNNLGVIRFTIEIKSIVISSITLTFW